MVKGDRGAINRQWFINRPGGSDAGGESLMSDTERELMMSRVVLHWDDDLI